MQLNKKDLITITVLSVIFFSMATWNLGSTQTPTTTTQIYPSQSFYIDLANQSNVGSVYILVKDGNYSLTISTGTPGNWQTAATGSTSYNYYRWKHIDLNQVTQYIKVDAANDTSSGLIAEIGVLDSNNQKLPITSITNLGSENPTLNNLIDEQNKVNLPDTYMEGTYFDEIYFVRTAEQYLHLQSPYEWTHPPLGKLIQAVGIVAVGFNPFGWRIMGVLFGTLMIPVMYLLGKRLFGSWIGAFTSAFLLTFDFMHFTMARMGTADTYVVFFLITAQLFFLVYFMNVLKKGWSTPTLPLFLSVIFFILSFSTKWIAMYGAIGMLALLVALRVKDLSKLKGIVNKFTGFFDHPFLLLLGFIAVAVGIYFVIYIPDMFTGRLLYVGDGRGVIDLQFAMYNYHAKLVAEHSFSSPWWSWPLLVSFKGYVPLWLDVWYLPNAMKSAIAVLGNPAIWWTGFACIFVTVERAIRKKDVAALFISSLFFFSWIPYVFISRLTFIYHFYIAVPFLCLAAAYVINKYWERKWGKVATIAFFVVVVVLFGVFYDLLSGAPTSASWIEKLRLFPSWYF